MTGPKRLSRGIAAAAVLAAATTATTLLTSSADAMPGDQPSCAPGQLTAQVTENPHQPGTPVPYTLTLTTNTDSACRISATPTHLVFHDAHDTPLGINSAPTNPTSHAQAELWPGQHAQATLLAAPDNTPGAPATSLTFDQPTPHGTLLHLTATWPNPVNGPIHISPVGGTTS